MLGPKPSHDWCFTAPWGQDLLVAVQAWHRKDGGDITGQLMAHAMNVGGTLPGMLPPEGMLPAMGANSDINATRAFELLQSMQVRGCY